MACFFHAEARCRGGKPVNRLGFEVMVQTGLKMACSIGRLTGQSILPTSFVTGAFKLARRNMRGNKHAFTVQDFCCEFMPITSNRVLQKQREAEWFDNLKYNLLPYCLSSMDCALQPLVRARKVRAAFLGFALARRCLNESVHFEFVLRRYDDQRFGRNSVSNLDSLPKILEKMMSDGIDQQRLKDAMEFAVETLGVHARTGYLTHSIEVQTGEVPNYKAETCGVCSGTPRQPCVLQCEFVLQCYAVVGKIACVAEQFFPSLSSFPSLGALRICCATVEANCQATISALLGPRHQTRHKYE